MTEKQIERIEDLLVEFDEYGFAPTITMPNAEEKAIEWRNELKREIKALISKVQEYEDKIENGTLVELPCKVGDTVYFIDDKQWLWEMIVVEIIILKKNIICEIGNGKKEVRCIYKQNWGKNAFLTKTEAEARLKELRK